MADGKKKKAANRTRKTDDNPNRSIRTLGNREKLLELLANTGCSLSTAARKLKLGVRTVYEWQAADPEFKAAVDATIQGPGTDALEELAVEHSLNGVQKVLTYQGQIQYQMTDPELDESGEVVVPAEYILDKKGEKIPVTVTEYDHGLLTRIIEMRRRRKDLALDGTYVVNIQALQEARERVTNG